MRNKILDIPKRNKATPAWMTQSGRNKEDFQLCLLQDEESRITERTNCVWFLIWAKAQISSATPDGYRDTQIHTN